MLETLFKKAAGMKTKKFAPALVFFCEFWATFKDNYFVEHLRTAASGK